MRISKIMERVSMEKLLEKLLLINHQLEDAGLGEFDFEQLHKVLCECEQVGPEIVRHEREHKVFRNNLILQTKGRLRALEIAREGKSTSIGADREKHLDNLSAEKLLEFYAELGRELNRVLPCQPNFLRRVQAEVNPADDKNYKIGG